MTRRLSALVLPFAGLASACSLQPAYRSPSLEAPSSWSGPPAASRLSQLDEHAGWWTALGDAQIDQLVIAGLRDNPSLEEVKARLDQARAALRMSDAQRLPSLSADGSVARSQDRDPTGSGTMQQTTGGLGATLAWELDLWGRVRESRLAARSRLSARTADAQGVFLSIVGEIADTAIALRTCNLVLEIRDRDIRSRETELRFLHTRLAFGNVAPVAVAAAQSNLANVRTMRISQAESCRRRVNALVALTGLDTPSIDTLLPPPSAERPATRNDLAASIAQPPPFAPALPAIVLMGHPGVISAEREVAARWSEIAVSRAERLPRVNLTAALSGQWISALGSSDTYMSGSGGAGLSMPFFDGGRGAAKVRGSEAAYREAEAQLVLTVRTAIRDIEDALAAQRSALERQRTARDAVEAASLTLSASDARFRAGSIAQFELEDARRQFNAAQESEIIAASDRARAWVSLVRRTGPSLTGSTKQSGASLAPVHTRRPAARSSYP